ncbi:MAG: anthranilate phosphoribosyltransferase [Candidatus Hermodarchaeota archaeon]
MISTSILKLIEFQDLTIEEAKNTMEQIMNGEVSEPQIAAFLTASRMKDISAEELTGFLKVMKSKVASVQYLRSEPILDVCGTGGASFKTFNASTTSAFILAAGGVSVAKHGNRSFTSKCGSADILEAIGFNINMDKKTAESLLNKYQITFLFAPLYHPAMKHVAPVRKSLGIRTIFNILGPLTNPAGVNRQFIGVFDKNLIIKFLKVFQRCDYESAFVVHGEIGADELVTCGKTFAGQLVNSNISTFEITPQILGLEKSHPNDLQNLAPEEASQKMVRIYQGEKGPVTDFVLANTAGGFLVSGKVNTLQEGVELSKSVLDSGKALDLLEKTIKETGGDIERFNKLL